MIYLTGELLIAREDPKLTEKDGKKFCSVTLCSTKSIKGADGNYKDHYTFYTAFLSGAMAEKMAKYHKGDIILVSGEPYTSPKWRDKDGQERNGTLRLILSAFKLLKSSVTVQEQPRDEFDMSEDVSDLPF